MRENTMACKSFPFVPSLYLKYRKELKNMPANCNFHMFKYSSLNQYMKGHLLTQ